MALVDPLSFDEQYQNAIGYDSYVSAQILMQAISEFQDARMASEVGASQVNLEHQKVWQSIKRKIYSATNGVDATVNVTSLTSTGANGLTPAEQKYLTGGFITVTSAAGVTTVTSVAGILTGTGLNFGGNWSKEGAQTASAAIQGELDKYTSDGTATTLRMQDITNKKNLATEAWSAIQKAKNQVLESIIRALGG